MLEGSGRLAFQYQISATKDPFGKLLVSFLPSYPIVSESYADACMAQVQHLIGAAAVNHLSNGVEVILRAGLQALLMSWERSSILHKPVLPLVRHDGQVVQRPPPGTLILNFAAPRPKVGP